MEGLLVSAICSRSASDQATSVRATPGGKGSGGSTVPCCATAFVPKSDMTVNVTPNGFHIVRLPALVFTDDSIMPVAVHSRFGIGPPAILEQFLQEIPRQA